MDSIDTWFDKLKQEIYDGDVAKQTAVKCRDYYNAENERKIGDCMCNRMRRKILAVDMLEWYESRN